MKSLTRSCIVLVTLCAFVTSALCDGQEREQIGGSVLSLRVYARNFEEADLTDYALAVGRGKSYAIYALGEELYVIYFRGEITPSALEVRELDIVRPTGLRPCKYERFPLRVSDGRQWVFQLTRKAVVDDARTTVSNHFARAGCLATDFIEVQGKEVHVLVSGRCQEQEVPNIGHQMSSGGVHVVDSFLRTDVATPGEESQRDEDL